MYLRRIAEQERMINELVRLGFVEARDGRSLRNLSIQELQLEYVRLPELKEIRNEEAN